MHFPILWKGPSHSGYRGQQPADHASKGALRIMAKTDALLYARDRIRVNSVHPGLIWTPMVEAYLKTTGSELVIDGGYTAR